MINTSRSTIQTVWLIIGILLIAANLRASITAIGPLIGHIRAATGISNTWAGFLTTLPLLGFAFFSPIAPIIARRFGLERTIGLSLAAIATGICIRLIPSIIALFVGTALLGAAIGVVNVLLPGLIKRDYPERIGMLTGAYSVAMGVFAGLAAGISIPLADDAGLGWRGTLFVWLFLAVPAILVWLPQYKNSLLPLRNAALTGGNIWRSRLAWQISLFMGLQSFLFYVAIAWLPQILVDRGSDPETAGWMLFLMQLAGLPATFLVPVWAGKLADQRGVVAVVIAFSAAGWIGLLLDQKAQWAWLWVIFIGIALGAFISLALAFMGLRTHSASQAAQLSGMAQSVGYLLAAIGPTLAGLVHDLTHSWQLPLIALLFVNLLLLLFGLGAGRNVLMAEERPSHNQLSQSKYSG
nr:Major Facilitator Superfamily [uncultured bacterium]